MTLLDLLVVVAALMLAAFHAIQLVAIVTGARQIRRERRHDRPPLRDAAAGSGALPGVSALVHAPGDGVSARRLIDTLLDQRYPDLEIIVVADSATTTALDTLSHRFPLEIADPRPRANLPTERIRAVFTAQDRDTLLVVDKRGGDRADALNAALNLASRPFVLSIAPHANVGADALADAAMPLALDPSATVSWTAPAPIDLAATPSGEVDPLVAGVDALRRARIRLESVATTADPTRTLAPFVMALFRRDALMQLGGFEPYAVEPETSLVRRLEAPRLAQPAEVDVRRQAARGWGALTADGAPDTALARGAALIEAAGWALVLVGLAVGLISWQTTIFFASAALVLGLCTSLAALLVDVLDGHSTPSTATVAWYALIAAVEQLGPRQLAAFTRLRAWVLPDRSAAAA